MNKNNTSNPSIEELGHSPDALAQRKVELLALLAQNAPELISDNQLFVTKLQELLGEDCVAPEEHYELSWAGKTAARREIQKTSSHTLRPDANNPAQAQHMLIEGENLEVLRVLQKSYYGKIKMIYIDPPYNTGNDSFVYPDNYSETLDEYQRRAGEKNEAGFLNKQSLWKKNSKESGQYHSAWLSMMYPRLYLARNLLRDDGIIFISIDDNEAANLKLLCDEVFGGENFVELFVIRTNPRGNQAKKFTASEHEYLLCYSKNKKSLVPLGFTKEEGEFSKLDEGGSYREIGLRKRGAGSRREDAPNQYYPIYFNPQQQLISTVFFEGAIKILPKLSDGSDGRWRWAKSTVEEKKTSLLVRFVKRGDQQEYDVFEKDYFAEDKISKVKSIFYEKEVNFENATEELKQIFGRKLFDYPKPVYTLKRIIKSINSTSGIILDFFAGSGTTAQAVFELNIEDGGSRQCLCVQMPEVLDEHSDAYKAGYRTIADITRDRIDKVIAKIKAEHTDKAAELACAHFTLAPSNFKVWHGDVSSADVLREQLSMFQSAEKGGQSKQADAQTAMLTELLLKNGLGALGVQAISKPREVAGVTIHRVLMADDKTMWLCFEPYTEALKGEIVKSMPAQVVMLNSCFVGTKADEQLANLQLELAGLDIGLTVI